MGSGYPLGVRDQSKNAFRISEAIHLLRKAIKLFGS